MTACSHALARPGDRGGLKHAKVEVRLARLHREIVLPDMQRLNAELEQRLEGRFDDINRHFDEIYKRFDRLETPTTPGDRPVAPTRWDVDGRSPGRPRRARQD